MSRFFAFVCACLFVVFSSCKDEPEDPAQKEIEKHCSVEAEIQTVSRPYTNVFGIPVVAIFWTKPQNVFNENDGECVTPFPRNASNTSAVWEVLGAGATRLAGTDLAFPVKAKLYYRLVSPWTPLVVQLKDIKFPELDQPVPAPPPVPEGLPHTH